VDGALFAWQGNGCVHPKRGMGFVSRGHRGVFWEVVWCVCCVARVRATCATVAPPVAAADPSLPVRGVACISSPRASLPPGDMRALARTRARPRPRRCLHFLLFLARTQTNVGCSNHVDSLSSSCSLPQCCDKNGKTYEQKTENTRIPQYAARESYVRFSKTRREPYTRRLNVCSTLFVRMLYTNTSPGGRSGSHAYAHAQASKPKSRPASQQASKPASQQASKPASQRASKPAS